jgi:Zn-dependent metalloprotease
MWIYSSEQFLDYTMRRAMKTLLSFSLLLAISLPFSVFSQEVEQTRPRDAQVKVKPIPGVTQEQQRALEALAHEGGGSISVRWHEKNGTPTFLSGTIPSEIVKTKSAEAYQNAALLFLKQNTTIFKLRDATSELTLHQAQEDGLGMYHLKFNQTFEGIPVWGAQIIVHFNKGGRLETVNGRYHPSFSISTVPAVSSDRAISLAQQHVGYTSTNPTTTLYIYPQDDALLLAWRVLLPSNEYPNMDLFVDARNGSILRMDNGIRYNNSPRIEEKKKAASSDDTTPRKEPVRVRMNGEAWEITPIDTHQKTLQASTALANSGPTDSLDWQYIFSDGFEGSFPGTAWTKKSTGSSQAFWDTTWYKAHTGIKSLYCARSGTYGRDPRVTSTYPYNMYTLVRYGPFSLSDATNAIVRFSHWTYSEAGFDYFIAMVSLDTVDYYGYGYSGNFTTLASADSRGWQMDCMNLTAVPGINDLRGQTKVWIAFLFTSDNSYVYQGTFLDDVEIRKELLAGGALATGSGIGSDGNTKTLQTARIGSTYYLIDGSREMFRSPVSREQGVITTWDAQNDTMGTSSRLLTRVIDPNGDNNFNDNLKLRAGVDAHYYTGLVYDYYKKVHSRNSWDNNGTSLRSVVHYLSRYNNAFWNGAYMTYGDGDGVLFGSFAGALDVAAHEITHGVIESSAELMYEKQSGALNESYADIFGTFVEFYARGTAANWLMGEEILTPGIPNDALRNLQNPHLGYDWQPAHMTEYVELLNNGSNDYGGVHINSGIPSRVCYLVSTTIGIAKTERIYYRALTLYLTSAAQFLDARNATLQSAADLYGNPSAEYTAVESAFNAVGLTPDALRELVYDSGYPAGGTAWSSSGAMYACRMSPSVLPARIVKLDYYINGYSTGSRRFTVRILKDSAGVPGSNLISPFLVYPQSDGWYSVDLSNYAASYHTVVNGGFFVAMQYDGTNSPYLGYTEGSNGRGWSRSSSTASWTQRDRTYFIRATVSASVGAPTSNFAATPTSGSQPLTVSFTNQSTGVILSYFWNFGDGYTSTEREPVHIYSSGGTRTVSLTTIGPGGTNEFSREGYISVNATTGVEVSDATQIPNSFELRQNFPNPFNPATTVAFDLPKPAYALLEVYSLLGERVAVIVSEDLPAGKYTRAWDAERMPSGIYYCRMTAGEFIAIKKMLLLR